MSDEKPVGTADREQLLREIAEQVIAKGGAFDEARVRDMIGAELNALVEDKEFRRKMRFGPAEGEDMGGRYAGLDPVDIELLYNLVASAGERGVKMSDSLERAAVAANERIVTSKADASEFAHRRAFGARDEVVPWSARKRAMDTAESGYGSQLIGAQYLGGLWEAARREARVFPLIRSFTMTAPTAYLPVEVDFPQLLYVSENTANNSSNYTTTKTGSQRVTVSAVKFVLHQMWSGEMEEDAIIPYLPFLRGQAQKALSWYQDNLVLRGDTTTAATSNLNDIDGTPTATDWYLAWDGIDHVGLVDNTNNQIDAAGAITYEDLINAKSKMIDRTYFHDWGHPNSPADLVYVSEPATADAIALLDEVITVDKYGSNATVLTGELGNIGRHPLIVCDAHRLTESTGFIDKTVSDNTKGIVTVFNRNAFVLGIRRALQVETERIPATDQNRIVFSMRWGMGRFSPTGAASGIEGSCTIFDITV